MSACSGLFVEDQIWQLELVCPKYDFALSPIKNVKCVQAMPYRYDVHGYPKQLLSSKKAVDEFARKISHPGLRRWIRFRRLIATDFEDADAKSGLSPKQMSEISKSSINVAIFDWDGTITQTDMMYGHSLSNAAEAISLVTNTKVKPIDMVEMHFGGKARLSSVINMMRTLKKRKTHIFILTSNGHKDIEQYIHDMFRAIKIDVPKENVRRTRSYISKRGGVEQIMSEVCQKNKSRSQKSKSQKGN
jgi:hypothetical protein